MKHFLATASILAVLSGCDSSQPFDFGGEDTIEEPTIDSPPGDPELDPTDPNVEVNDLYAYDVESGLTLNGVSYDAANDVVAINNLPFDGPSGGYDFVRDLGNGMSLYRSRQTATTGQLIYYAVLRSTDNITVTAANGRDWGDFGYGGANVNRTAFGLPEGADNTVPDGTPDVGEYVYTGGYAGLRAFSDRGGIEIVDGQVRLLLDINDLDPDGTTQGSLVATVFDRQSRTESGGFINDLPNISLKRLNFETTTGVFNEGNAETFFDGEGRDSGTYDAMVAASDGTEVGGTVVMEGVANIQNVRHETVDYTVTTMVTEQQIVIDPVTFLPTTIDVTRTIVESGSSSALTEDRILGVQAIIDAGRFVPDVTVDRSMLPTGAVVTDSRFSETEFKTEFEAREIGAFTTIQTPTP